MGKMAQLLHIFQKLPKEISAPVFSEPIFDKKYKIIVKCKYTPSHTEMLECVKYQGSFVTGLENAYFGFQDSGDALFFKIKYSV